jgi:hypothetical protein|tara:strand:- start:325 stop:645 length:321 start_codon:yes stop_codon:yes gene_type:complete
MNYLKILVLLNLILFIYSCGAAREGFTNQKKENKDEFLVEKKSPLMMPPDYDELPLPNPEAGDTQNSENNVKKLIINNENDNSKSLNQDGSNKKIEESLIEKIKNN